MLGSVSPMYPLSTPIITTPNRQHSPSNQSLMLAYLGIQSPQAFLTASLPSVITCHSLIYVRLHWVRVWVFEVWDCKVAALVTPRLRMPAREFKSAVWFDIPNRQPKKGPFFGRFHSLQVLSLSISDHPCCPPANPNHKHKCNKSPASTFPLV